MEKMTTKNNKYCVLIPLIVLVLVFTSMFFGSESRVYGASDYVTINNEKYYYLTDVNYVYAVTYGGKFILSDDLYPSHYIFVAPESGSLTLYLNGYSIYGDNLEGGSIIEVAKDCTLILEDSEERHGGICNNLYEAIIAESSNLILRNVDIYDCHVGIFVSNGTVSVEGTSSVFSNQCGIVSNKSSVTITDNARVSFNSAFGIEDESESIVSVGGNANLTRNGTAILTDDTTELHLSDNVRVEENYKNGVLVNDKQYVEINPGSEMYVPFSISDYSNDTYELYFIASNERGLISPYIEAVPGFTSVYLNDSSITGNWVCISSGTCDKHNCEFVIGDFSISEKCVWCFSRYDFDLIIGNFDNEEHHAYYEGCNLSDKVYMACELDGYKNISPYPTIIYGYFDTDTGEESYSTEVPSEIGVYAVKLAMLDTENDLDSILASTPEHIFAITPKVDNCTHDFGSYYEEYYDDGRVITARCDDCGKLLMKVEVNTNNTDISQRYENDGSKILYLCDDDEVVAKWEGDEEYLDNLSFVYGYYQNDGSLKYSLDAPTQPGKYIARIAILEDDNNPYTTLISTDDLQYEIQYHRWTYSSDETSIYAHCDCCGENASVHLDSSGADYASRHYDDTSKEEYFDYDIFYQENWINQLGIDQFYILYDGVAIEDEFNSTIKSNYFYKPTVSGNYTARIVLLKNVYNPSNAYQSTDAMQYHLAGYLIGNPYMKIVDYSAEQYAALKEPFCIDGVYQVGSFEDLMWVARYCSDKDINITCDIVMNPITITDDGETVRCGSSTIYKWLGLGNSYTGEYTGNIYGNGHTIYGLYCIDQDYAGLIGNGCNNLVQDLTISDSVLYSKLNAGGIIGYSLSKTDANTAGEVKVCNCNVINCSIKQGGDQGYSKAAGGIIGRFYSYTTSKLTVNDCIVDSYISGYEAGGIIGKIDAWKPSVNICGCVNLGNIFGDYDAGGLVGYNSSRILCNITKCANAGNIEGMYAGGIWGGLLDPNEGGVLNDCINIGRINSSSSYEVGGLFGLVRGVVLSAQNNSYYGAVNAIGENYDKDYVSDIGVATKLSKSQATTDYICSVIGCTKASSWTTDKLADCEHSGEITKKCLVCGKVIESKTIPSHGHNYGLEGKCVYCMEEKSNDTASVFSGSNIGIYILVPTVILVAVIAIIVIYKKTKHQ